MTGSGEQIIRGTWEAWDAAFAGDEDAFLEGIATDVEWIPLMAMLEGRVFHGHDGMRVWLEDLRRDWEIFDPHFAEVRDLGRDQYLVLGNWRVRARNSGVEVTQPAGWMMQLKEGKVARMQTFTDQTEAIRVAERLRTEN